MNVLVTGGAGFIGSHLVEKLLGRGDKVTVLDDFSAGQLENIDEIRYEIGIGVGSVADRSFVRRCCRNKDVIFHLATQCLVKGNEDPLLIHEVNDIGTYNICIAAKENNCKIVYIGTSEEYGPQRKYPIKETAPMNPVSLYGLTKFIGERYVRFYHEIYDVPAVIIRPFNTFGPRQREDAYAGVITSFLKCVIANLPLTINGDGKQTRDFTYISDTVDGVLLLSKLKDGEIINLGSGQEVSINTLAKLMPIALGYDPSINYPIEHREARVNDLRRLRANISQARKYGYKPKISLTEGLRKYVEWYKGNRDRK
jgi:UDP-glucose 4-epimerase